MEKETVLETDIYQSTQFVLIRPQPLQAVHS